MSSPERGLRAHLTPRQSTSEGHIMTAAHRMDTASARYVGTPHSIAIPGSPVGPPQNANPLAANTANEANLLSVRRTTALENDQIRGVVAISGNQRAKKRPGRGGISQCGRCRKAKRGTKVLFPTLYGFANMT